MSIPYAPSLLPAWRFPSGTLLNRLKKVTWSTPWGWECGLATVTDLAFWGLCDHFRLGVGETTLKACTVLRGDAS